MATQMTTGRTMRTRVRKLIATAVAAGLLAAMAGCSSSEEGRGKTLVYWASNQGTSLDHDRAALKPVLDEFTKKTGTKVSLEVIGWGDLQTRLQTAVASGQAPDVTNIGNTWATSLQATGAFLPFDDANMDAIGGSDRFVKRALETGGAEGKAPTSVPLYGLAYGLFYNKAMLKKAGVEPPANWAELVTAARRLTTGGVHGMVLPAGSYTENAHLAFITAAQNGAELFDGSGAPTFTRDGVVDGILRYLDLMQTDRVVDVSNVQLRTGGEAMAEFASGKAAMILSQSNSTTTLAANGFPDSDYGVVPFPSPAGGKKVAGMVSGINLSIFKNTKQKDAALALVKHLTSTSAQEELGHEFATLPVLTDAKADVPGNPENAAIFQKIYSTMSLPLPRVPAEDQFESTVGNGMNELFTQIATGRTVSRADVLAMLKNAQEQVAQAAG